MQDIIHAAGKTVREVQRCMGYSTESSWHLTLKRINNWGARMSTLRKAANCIGLPAWYVLYLMSPDVEDSFFDSNAQPHIEIMERLREKSTNLLFAYAMELKRRGKLTPRLEEYLDSL